MFLIAALIVALVAFPTAQLEARTRWPFATAAACALAFTGTAVALLNLQSPYFVVEFLSPTTALHLDSLRVYGGVAGAYATVILLALGISRWVRRLRRPTADRLT
jgi:hypothetical protein